ncbi:hypothetical protein KC19_VG060300 [Ceratodon purpureus]|uniref:Uncharacterized protein n=1 Tax=Ceratodon purpureus TaxID=3225 RepID=A0A8T0HMF4_CERPU|nr:hypothetical protein KC19_VG060300 [Ceratodon purpureus]
MKPLEGYIASALGPVYVADPQNSRLRDPRFCVGLDLTDGWPSALRIVGLGGHEHCLLVNYDHAPVRCRFCLSLKHKVADCEELRNNGLTGAPRRVYGPERVQQERRPPERPRGAVPRNHPPEKKDHPSGTRPPPSQGTPPPPPPVPQGDAPGPREDNQGFTLVRSRRNKTPSVTSQPPNGATDPTRDKSPPKVTTPPQPVLPLTTDQVVGMLVEENDQELSSPMTWSPGRYGRNPGAKRSARSSQSCSSPAHSSATSK